MNKYANFYLTAEGVKTLARQQQSLKKRLTDMALQLRLLRSRDNVVENGDLELAEEEQTVLQRQFDELTYIIKKADRLKPSRSGAEVELGSAVRVSTGRSVYSYQVVSPLEVNPAEGKISDQSPLGKALLGAKVRQTVVVTSPKGTLRYRVEAINGHV